MKNLRKYRTIVDSVVDTSTRLLQVSSAKRSAFEVACPQRGTLLTSCRIYCRQHLYIPI